jgi:hypothetical protein
MRKSHVAAALPAVIFAGALDACTATQQATAQADIQQAVLVVDQGACDAQAAANDATTILTAAGDTAGAAQTSKVSATAGAACMKLAPASSTATPTAPVAAPATPPS